MPHGLLPGDDEEEIPAFVGFPDEILQRPAGAAGIIAVDGELEAIVDESLQNFSGEAGAEDEKVLADGALVQRDAPVYRTFIASSSAEDAFFTCFSAPEITAMETPFWVTVSVE